MDVTVERSKQFQPVELRLNLTSQRELLALYCLFNYIPILHSLESVSAMHADTWAGIAGKIDDALGEDLNFHTEWDEFTKTLETHATLLASVDRRRKEGGL